ncbi:MAG TPA: alpha-amylase family protein [Woeseiaceae bacterium]|nr:alpha-amylase family protein [Woeseiaceae bacterium]
MPDHWWKDAVIYAVDVERFCDSNGDGFGDFKGLESKLPYLADLGVTCLWLLPFYPSSNRDNGYDITDYLRIDTRHGVFGDFIDCLHKAGEHGIRVVVDLVAQHTSDQHPWFQAARHNANSRYRGYYVWTHSPPPVQPGEGTIFPGEESSVWKYDECAGAYYHHRFYRFQPTLNFANPDVREEIERIIDYWLSFGIAGFRLDAASHIVDHPLAEVGAEPQPPDVLREFYDRSTGFKPDVLLLGEVDEDPKELNEFFDGTRLNMMFNFWLDNYLLLALADERCEPIFHGLSLLPLPPANGQWANFLRNLDEADLERLAPDELQRVFERFAPEERMRLYGRGVRRRLAPMLEGDPRRLKMAYSLLFSMPGAPVITYGDEIGMGEDLERQGRNAVRSPMQWTSGTNGGFSTAPQKKLAQPMVNDDRFGFEQVNVADQQRDPESLLSFITRLAHLRRAHRAIGSGSCTVLDSGSEHVLAHSFKSDHSPLLFLHNLGGESVRVEVELGPGMDEPACLLGGEIGELREGRLALELEPYGVRWLEQQGVEG